MLVYFYQNFNHADRDRRLVDLDKINKLESKLGVELKNLHIKQNTIAKELKKVGNVEDFKKDAEAMKQKNVVDREVLQSQRDFLKGQVAAVSQKNDAMAAHLNENETHNQLSSLEQKLRHHEGNNFLLKECIYGVG